MKAETKDDKYDNERYKNDPIKEPLINSEQEVLSNLEKLSMKVMKNCKEIDDIEEILQTNPSQKEFSQAKFNLEREIGNLADIQDQHIESKNSFALFPYPSITNKAKYDKYIQKLEEIIGNLLKKTYNLSIQMQKIQKNNKFEDIDNPVSSSNNSSALTNQLLKKNVIDQKELLEKRGKALENAKV